LPAAPGYAVRGELLYRHASGVYIGPTFDMIDDRYADFSNTYKVDSYELIGLRAGYTYQRWEVFAEATNLLDKDYVALVSVRKSLTDAAVYPGRRFLSMPAFVSAVKSTQAVASPTGTTDPQGGGAQRYRAAWRWHSGRPRRSILLTR
jgi:hypothetical protein